MQKVISLIIIFICSLLSSLLLWKPEKKRENRKKWTLWEWGMFLLIAFGTCLIALFIERNAQAIPYAGALTAGCLCGISVLVQSVLPEKDWIIHIRELQDIPESKNPVSLNLILPGILSGTDAVMLLFYLTVHMSGAAELLASALIPALFFFGSIAILVLTGQYRKEKISALSEQQSHGEMLSFMSIIRAQRHDYNFHVQTLAELFREGDMEECRSYLNELVEDSMEMNSVLPVKDPAISAMIHSFRSMASRAGIELYLDIEDDLSRVASNVYETNKIISNLLQNAIDEVKTHEDKSYGIHLTVLKRGEYAVIQVANRLPAGEDDAAQIGDLFRTGYTTKKGHTGLGLSSVKALLEKYRGVIYVRVERGIIQFTAKIPMTYEKLGVDPMEE